MLTVKKKKKNKKNKKNTPATLSCLFHFQQ